jgi:predicted nucleic acid-binding Zn finger protein
MNKTITVKGKTGTYQVSKYSCTCGDYIYRKKDIGGKCKHMEALEE